MHVHAESRNDGQTISNQGESQWNTLDIDHWKFLWTPWNPLKSRNPCRTNTKLLWKSTGNPFSMNFRENDYPMENSVKPYVDHFRKPLHFRRLHDVFWFDSWIILPEVCKKAALLSSLGPLFCQFTGLSQSSDWACILLLLTIIKKFYSNSGRKAFIWEMASH